MTVQQQQELDAARETVAKYEKLQRFESEAEAFTRRMSAHADFNLGIPSVLSLLALTHPRGWFYSCVNSADGLRVNIGANGLTPDQAERAVVYINNLVKSGRVVAEGEE